MNRFDQALVDFTLGDRGAAIHRWVIIVALSLLAGLALGQVVAFGAVR